MAQERNGRRSGRQNRQQDAQRTRRGTLDLSKVSVVAELGALEVPHEFTGPEELVAICPFHEDTTPSCCINTEKRLFNCKSCKASGDFVTYMAKVIGVSRTTVAHDLIKRYGSAGDKPVSSDMVEKFHAALGDAGPLWTELEKRGVTKAIARKHRLGFDSATGRITIPIPDETSGAWTNVKKYLPGAPGREKMRSLRTRGHTKLYPPDQLKYDEIVVVGGELKALVTADRMNPLGVGAVTATGGEGNWDVAFNPRFRGKKVWVCMDVDEAGRAATQIICRALSRSASELFAVELPLDPAVYPKGDVNDYFGTTEKRTGKDFRKVLAAAEPWAPPSTVPTEADVPEPVALAEAMKSENVGKRVQVKAVVRALHETPYYIPAEVRCSCSRDEDCCHECPVYPTEQDQHGFTPLTISSESPGILAMMGEQKFRQRERIQEAVGIPSACKSCEFIVDRHYSVEDARVAPHLDISSRSVDREMVPAAIIGNSLELNSGYVMRGRMWPHPQTQQAYLLVSQFEPAEDALSTYRPSDESLRDLVAFRPRKWELGSLEERLSGLYGDLSANVTRIYEREDMHRSMDLSFHSPLMIDFDGSRVKGWTEVLVIGDSSQGKSDTMAALMRHYGVGGKVDCKNATTAGILGGLQKLGNRFFVSWGVIPTHDARLLALEEMKGMSLDLIGKLTDMRSSGIAEIPKIEKRRTLARTRLVGISNPRSGHPMSSYNYGVEAVRELLGAAEDVRRFDLVCVVAAGQVDPDKINSLQRHRPEVPHCFGSDLCRRLVLWAWTRKGAEFEHDAKELVLDEASRLCREYSETIPIVDRGSARHKLARLAAACAARTFSATADNSDGVVLVRRCHVESVVALIERMYADPAFGYLEYSKSAAEMDSMRERDEVRRRLFAAQHAQDLVSQLLANDSVEMRDICDWCGYDRGDAAELLSLLTRRGALRRPPKERHYRKSPDFIALLREMRDSKEMKALGAPAFARRSTAKGQQREVDEKTKVRATVVVPDDDV